MSRTQHIIPSGIVFVVGCWIAWVSYTQQPAEAFLFPRLISTAFVALAGWTFLKALLGWSKVGSGVPRHLAINLAPGLIISLIYIFFLAKALGFYTATAIAFVCIQLPDFPAVSLLIIVCVDIIEEVKNAGPAGGSCCR